MGWCISYLRSLSNVVLVPCVACTGGSHTSNRKTLCCSALSHPKMRLRLKGQTCTYGLSKYVVVQDNASWQQLNQAIVRLHPELASSSYTLSLNKKVHRIRHSHQTWLDSDANFLSWSERVVQVSSHYLSTAGCLARKRRRLRERPWHLQRGPALDSGG